MVPVRDSVYEAVLGFSSPLTKHLEQAVPQKKVSPSLSDSSYHCFSFIGQIFNDLWWSGSQPALACAKTTHPPLFLLGDTKDRVPNPVPFVGVFERRQVQTAERKRKEMHLLVAAPALVYFLNYCLWPQFKRAVPCRIGL